MAEHHLCNKLLKAYHTLIFAVLRCDRPALRVCLCVIYGPIREEALSWLSLALQTKQAFALVLTPDEHLKS